MNSAAGPKSFPTIIRQADQDITSVRDALGIATSATYTIRVAPAAIKLPATTAALPTVTLSVPTCAKRLSKKACKRFQDSPAARQTLSGGVIGHSSPAKVQVAMYLTNGRQVEGLVGKHFRKTTKAQARMTFVTASISGLHWSLRLPRLRPGTYTVIVRATDTAGLTSAIISRTVRLR